MVPSVGCPRQRGAALIRGAHDGAVLPTTARCCSDPRRLPSVVRSTSTSTSTTTSTSSSRSRDRSRSRSHSRSITTATTTFQRAATAVVDVFQRGGHPSPLVIGRPDSSRWQTRSPLAVLVRHKLMHPGIIEQVPRMRMRRTGAAPPAPSSTCSSSSQVSVQLIADRTILAPTDY